MSNRVKAKLKNLTKRRKAFEKIPATDQKKFKRPGSRKK